MEDEYDSPLLLSIYNRCLAIEQPATPVKILIVDDSARMREVIRASLCQAGKKPVDIVECDDGKQATELFDVVLPDWVLMDVRLPHMNGMEATRRILRKHPDAKILIVTQYDEPVYREEAEDAGARGFVLKEHLDEIPRILLGSSTREISDRGS
jgi:DNA-binding NarL/FixJ family response regulator